MFKELQAVRLGLISPPSNAVMEVDFYRSLPCDVTVHTSHIYRVNRTVSAEAMTETAQNAADAAMSLVQVAPAVLLYGHAASSYAGGLSGDARIRERIVEATAIPTITVASAVVRCLRSIGVRRLWFIAPYPPAVVRQAVDFLTSNGFQVVAASGLGIDQVADLKQAPLQETYELAIRTAAGGDGEALYVCGTGIRTRPLVGPLEEALGRPVITANMAALWAALDAVGRASAFRFGSSTLLQWQGRCPT